MTKREALNGKPYAGNPHVRFDEGEAASTATSRRGSLLYKLKVNWKELARQLWAAIRPVLLGAIGGGIVSFASGCSSLTPSDKTQTMGVYAFGIPGIAVITQSHQTADNAGSDTNAAAQSNPVSVDTRVK